MARDLGLEPHKLDFVNRKQWQLALGAWKGETEEQDKEARKQARRAATSSRVLDFVNDEPVPKQQVPDPKDSSSTTQLPTQSSACLSLQPLQHHSHIEMLHNPDKDPEAMSQLPSAPKTPGDKLSERSLRPRSILLRLPAELLVHVFSFLDYPSLTRLRATCHRLRNHFLLPPLEVVKTTLLDYELGDDTTGLYNTIRASPDRARLRIHRDTGPHSTFLPCYTCLKILPRSAFIHAQREYRRDIAGVHAALRFCNECGINAVWKVPGRLPLKLEDGRWYLCCADCGKVVIQETRSVGDWLWARLCEGCWLKGGKKGFKRSIDLMKLQTCGS